MDKVNELNDLITRELELDYDDGGQRLTEILLFAEPLYKDHVSQYLMKSNGGKNAEIPENISKLGNNIIRLKRRLLAFGVSAEINVKGK